MTKYFQTGGSFTVNGWLALLLLAVAAASGAMNWHQHMHRQIQINVTMPHVACTQSI